MSENVTNELIFSVLQKMQADMSDIKFDIHDLKLRMTMVEEHVGNSIIAISGVNSRLDRVDERLSRVERRLDLSEAR